MIHYRKFSFVLFFCFSLIIATTPVKAITLFSQQPLEDTGPTSQTDVQIIADNFMLDADATITDLHWWGLYGTTTAPTDDFIIRFYGDDGSGLPDSIHLFEATATDFIGFTRTDSGLSTASGRTIYKYDTFLSESFSVQQNTMFYVSIVNNISTPAWGWARSGGNLDDHFSSPPPLGAGLVWVERNINQAFELTSDAVIPEPSTMLLLGAGLIGLAGMRRRVKK